LAKRKTQKNDMAQQVGRREGRKRKGVFSTENLFPQEPRASGEKRLGVVRSRGGKKARTAGRGGRTDEALKKIPISHKPRGSRPARKELRKGP